MADIALIQRKIEERRNLYSSSPRYEEIQSKILHSTLVTEVEDKPHIFRIELMNTFRCNAACAHCSNHKLNEDYPDIKRETVERVVQEAEKHRTPSVVILGGESILDPNLFDYIEMFSKIGIGIGVTSNCLSITRADLEKMKELGVAGSGSTIYDSIPENHDQVVGIPGAFQKIMDAREICLELGLGFSLCTVCLRSNLNNGAIERMIDFCEEIGSSFKINLVVPIGGSATEDQMLRPEEVEKIHRIVMTRKHLSTHCIFGGEKERCAIGRTYIGITPSGDILPCYFMPISLGNINEIGFAEYLEYSQTFPIFTKKALPKGFCLVAQSYKFFREILGPLYQQGQTLPIDVSRNPELEKQLRNFSVETV